MTESSGANGLPAGVSAHWALNTITISGTPTAAGQSVQLQHTFNRRLWLSECDGDDHGYSGQHSRGRASSTPTLCVNTALTAITHATTGATGISNDGVSGANGLPAGVSAHWALNTITISGTPTTSVGSPFNYSIALTGGCGSVNATGRSRLLRSIQQGSLKHTYLMCQHALPAIHACHHGSHWDIE